MLISSLMLGLWLCKQWWEKPWAHCKPLENIYVIHPKSIHVQLQKVSPSTRSTISLEKRTSDKTDCFARKASKVEGKHPALSLLLCYSISENLNFWRAYLGKADSIIPVGCIDFILPSIHLYLQWCGIDFACVSLNVLWQKTWSWIKAAVKWAVTLDLINSTHLISLWNLPRTVSVGDHQQIVDNCISMALITLSSSIPPGFRTEKLYSG